VLRAKNVQWMFSLRLPSFLVKDRDYRIHVSTAPSLKKKKKKKKKIKKKKKKKKKKGKYHTYGYYKISKT
jgi:hypothetical protein